MLCLRHDHNEFIELTDRHTGCVLGRLCLGRDGGHVRYVFHGFDGIQIDRRPMPDSGDLKDAPARDPELTMDAWRAARTELDEWRLAT